MQRFTLIFVAYLACIGATFVLTEEIFERNFDDDDTVSIEALSDEVNEVTTVILEDEPNTTELPRARQSRDESESGEGTYCVTNTGLSGTCTSVPECFPRLFPPDILLNDTPGATGVYNQNLAKFLIESSGICGGINAKRLGITTHDLLQPRTNEQICCASPKIAPEFPLDNDNDTSTIEIESKSCGILKIDPKSLPDRIVGGRKAVLGEFPWMVAMLKRGQQFCGASLLDDRNVLTAAHCVEYMTKSDVAALRLYLGDLDIYSSKDAMHTERRAKRVLYHKGFTMRNLDHDIALVHLDKPVKFSKTIQPVCIHPGMPRYDNGNQEADVTGWGTTSSGGSQSSQLLAVRLNITTQDDCNQKYSKAGKKIGAGMVCAGAPGKDSCQGDSGGPLVIDSRGQAKQVGIVSWGIGCASYPGVYTRVDRYKKWLAKNKQ